MLPVYHEYILSWNGKINHEEWIGKDLAGTGHSVSEVL